MRRALVVAATIPILAACNRGSTPDISLPALPTPTAPQTVYTGTITDSVSGAGTVAVSLGTAGSNVGGTWLATYQGQPGAARSIAGSVSGTAFSATVSDCIETDSFTCFPDCRQAFTGTLTSTGLSGTYAEVPGDTCAVHSGSVSANRQ